MGYKLLHVIEDEKFIDSAYEQFESVAPGVSRYVLPHARRPIKYLNQVQPDRVSRFSYLAPVFLRSLEKYDAVILHSLTPFACELIGRSSSNVRFLWIGMGYDYYDLIFDNELDMLESATRRIVEQYSPEFGQKTSSNIVRKLASNILFPNVKHKAELVHKISWFAPVLEVEYGLLGRTLGEIKPAYIDWNYGLTVKLIESGVTTDMVEGDNILVGNSASPYNNHIEVFTCLNEIHLPQNCKIIVPLSYGDDAAYRNKVIEEGERIFGRKFMPIVTFMSFDEYMGLIASCSTVIMNHNRQQAGGNITAALYMGAKVFLNVNNYFYNHYKDHGAIIYNINELTSRNILKEMKLTSVEININRSVMKSLRSRDVLQAKTRNLIETVSC